VFDKLPLWTNIALFSVAAVAVWLAGTRVAGWADVIARKTGLGQAAVGLLLLAGVTSLPEIAVTVTAAVGGNAQLAVNNLLGSVAMQVAILAVADSLIGKDALTAVLPDPKVLMQIALNMLLLGVVAGRSWMRRWRGRRRCLWMSWSGSSGRLGTRRRGGGWRSI
jgi:cation:H+ antiporter